MQGVLGQVAHYGCTFASCVDPLTRLPIELFHRTAGHLDLNGLFLAALVSRSWRAALLSAPLLWKRIDIYPRDRGKLAFVAHVLDAFLQRSQGLPVAVRLFLESDLDLEAAAAAFPHGAPSLDDFAAAFPVGGPSLDAITQLLAREMHRIRVLEIVIDEWHGTTWEDVLRRPAPLLERLTLDIARSDEDVPLPLDLFSNCAPRLRRVYLRNAFMPDRLVPALAGVTSLFYDHAGNCSLEQLATICAMRGLRDLTLAAKQAFYDQHAVVPACLGPQLRRLQLWNSPDAYVIMKHFPLPEHICFSASLMHDLPADPPGTPFDRRTTEPRFVTAILQANRGAARAVTIGFRAPRLALEAESPDEGAVYALQLNRRDVVVDLLLPELVSLLRVLPLPLFPALQVLSIPLALLPLFDVPGLPPLLRLVLYVPPPGDFPPLDDVVRTPHTHRVVSLGIVQVVAPEEWPAWDMHEKRPDADKLKVLPASTLLDFVQRKLVLADLRLVILDGYRLGGTPEELLLLQTAVPRVASLFSGGWLPDDDCAQWQWHFPEETAFMC